jgi:hypothetical protein
VDNVEETQDQIKAEIEAMSTKIFVVERVMAKI